jgi:uncharacterized protein
VKINIGDQTCHLLPEKGLFFPRTQTLVFADIHIGKSRVCREQGIAIPQTVCEEDLSRILLLSQYWKASRIIILGDLFHDAPTTELQLIKEWRYRLSSCQVVLIRGNHDRIKEQELEEIGINVLEELCEEEIRYIHSDDKALPDFINLCGHIHPGIVLGEKREKRLRLPCFARDECRFILPAFGTLTGLFMVETASYSDIFPVAEGKIWHISLRERIS